MNRLGIIGAMDAEIEKMKQDMDVTSEEQHASITFYVGRSFGKEVVLVKSGVGKVNAALTTQILIDRFQVKKIIFTGVAGALHRELNVGDVVISTSAIQHDLDASPLGFKKGEVPMFHLSSDFLADEGLVKAAFSVAQEKQGIQVMKGRILSGDQFIANRETVKELEETFSGVCVEMEGAAVAQVAVMNEVPFVIIRSISDQANGEADVSFAEFTALASEQSQRIVEGLLKRLEEY